MSEYFLQPKSFRETVKVEFDLSNYATKSNFKNATGVDTSKFAINVNLANIKSNKYILDIDKLKNLETKMLIN